MNKCKVTVNGYTIRWNGYWRYWQISHPEVGLCIAEFKIKQDAVNYCMAG